MNYRKPWASRWLDFFDSFLGYPACHVHHDIEVMESYVGSERQTKLHCRVCHYTWDATGGR